MEQGVSIIIPTCNGGRVFSQCLAAIKEQDYAGNLQLIIVDSGSTDKTVERAMAAGARIKRIDPEQFHHARTRNEALSLANHEKVVFMVQDAIPCSSNWLTALARALDDYPVAGVYTAQMPHVDATPYAAFEIESINEARGHVPVIQEIESQKSYEEAPYHQAYRMIGLDNVCAIYRKNRLVEVPFPEVDFAEDLAWAQKNLLLGHKILYNPLIKVKHSHNRSPSYAFRRQIINSYWCAKIMGRVEKDQSFMTVGDLKILTRGIHNFVINLRTNFLASGIKYSEDESLLLEILKKYPRGDWAKRFFTGKTPWRKGTESKGLKEINDYLETAIDASFRLIREKYGIEDQRELAILLNQVVANFLGRIYGEVYAGRLLKGNISRCLDSLMGFFLHGV